MISVAWAERELLHSTSLSLALGCPRLYLLSLTLEKLENQFRSFDIPSVENQSVKLPQNSPKTSLCLLKILAIFQEQKKDQNCLCYCRYQQWFSAWGWKNDEWSRIITFLSRKRVLFCSFVIIYRLFGLNWVFFIPLVLLLRHLKFMIGSQNVLFWFYQMHFLLEWFY